MIPHFRAHSLNIQGLVCEKSKDNKLVWLKQTCNKIPDLGVVLIQETHFKNTREAHKTLRRLGGKLLGISCSGSRSRGVVAWVPERSPIYSLIDTVNVSRQGRWAVLKITAASEHMHIANVYAPSDSKCAREEFFSAVKEKFDHLTNLVIAGDWNFVPEEIDAISGSQLVDPVEHPKAQELYTHLELDDLLRAYDSNVITITFRHVNGNYKARLDRFYTQAHMTDMWEPVDTIAAAAISDHDMVGAEFRNPEERIKPTDPYYRMSRYLIKQLANPNTKVYKNTIDYFDFARGYLDELTAEGVDDAAHIVWDDVKRKIMDYYKEVDRKHRNQQWKINNKMNAALIYNQHEPMAEQVKRKTEATEFFKRKQQEKIQNIKLHSDFNWIQDGEDCSKFFFQLTKLRNIQNKIPPLRDSEGEVTSCHSANKRVATAAFKSTFTKRVPDTEALKKVLDAIESTSTKLNQEEIDQISEKLAPENIANFNPAWGAEPETDWLVETIKTLKMASAPGPDGLPNEFYYLRVHRL